MNEEDNNCIAFGYFDGFHLGHAHIVNTVLELSKKHSLTPKVITFFDENSFRHTTEEEKHWFLHKKDVKHFSKLISVDFDIKQFLLNSSAKIIIVGENFAFRKTSLDDLQKIAHEIGIKVHICKTICHENIPIIMERINEALESNNLALYEKLCGHPYIFVGEIIKGKQIGRTVGMPTANIDFLPSKKLPQHGVYATSFQVDNETHRGMTNIGIRPTVDSESRISIETFILDFDRMIYGKTCIVEMISFVRGVKKFNSLQEVKNQVQKDIQTIKKSINFLSMHKF